MRLDWADALVFEVARSSTGFIDEARDARQARRHKRTWGDVDATALGMAALASGAWMLAQDEAVQGGIAPELFDPIRSRVEKVGIGLEPAALRLIFDKAVEEMGLAPSLSETGDFTVKGSGVGHTIIAGLMDYARDPSPILICQWCARPFTGRAGSEVCGNSCRAERSKARK